MAPGKACVHCGADCGSKPVSWNKLDFCCNGCMQVYRLLNENKLYKYYDIEKTPGIRVAEAEHGGKYEYLDKDDVKEGLYLFYDEGIARVKFYIPLIHCASCIWLLENLGKLNSGIKHSTVNFVKKEISISFNTHEISLRQLVELLVSIHYKPEITLNSDDGVDSAGKSRLLLYKIGVAGFVFGNVMLYSLPEYFNGEPLGESLGSFLYYLSYILTVPLVFYSGSDYLVSAFKNLIKGLINIDLPIALGILSLFGVTSYEVLSGSGPGYSDSLSGFLFFLLLGKWYQGKSYEALSFDRDYRSYFPVAVTRMDNEGEHSALLGEISRGDKLLIRNRELIPADSRLNEGTAMIDYSFVTGESAPVHKEPGDFLYAGGIQNGGSITITVEKEIEQSHLTSLWNQSRAEDHENKGIKALIDRVSTWFTLAVILIALSGFTWWIIDDSFSKAVMVLTSVLIVACPCALALTIPFTFGNVMRILGKGGMYIKNTSVIENIIETDTIVFDKTGTLTRPDMNRIRFVGKELSDKEKAYAYSLARQSTHPLSIAIASAYPYESRPARGYVEVAGRGIYAKIDGHDIKLGSCEYVTGKKDCGIHEKSAVYFSVDNNTRGYFEIGNFYRQGFEGLIKDISATYKTYLLSGDNDTEREFLENYFVPGNIHFNMDPHQKRDFIAGLQSGGRRVLMTGDGLNDSGAFMKSDVALSVADDIYHFSPAGDAIIDAEKFTRLPAYLSFCKRSMTIVRLSFFISFLYNIIGLSFALSGNLSPVVAAILMPLSSVSVVAFATLATRLPGNRMLKKISR
ncbi:MAG: heavy metal translocating P-type ATPase metal-binding domain-containing protein [Marinilabiliaceae bacterium]|jgi:Cu+-exporting ATPase|nr:heavy metal translocating P-type ATPase metal-binding domain-containing protein [Marinilabiliaceae bacterium]